jgi:hypothetical protein
MKEPNFNGYRYHQLEPDAPGAAMTIAPICTNAKYICSTLLTAAGVLVAPEEVVGDCEDDCNASLDVEVGVALV